MAGGILPTMRYCLPLLHRPVAEIQRAMRENAPHYGSFEVWLDSIPDFDSDTIPTILDAAPRSLILLWGRGASPLNRFDLAQRLALLEELSQRRVTIDLDLRRQQPELDLWERLENPKASILVSYHDYEATPDDEGIERILGALTHVTSASIIKLSTRCNSPDDALRLLKAERKLAADDVAHVVLGMGDAGLAVRIFASLWGNRWIYAPVNSEQCSAPGQLTRAQFETLAGILGGAQEA